MTSGRRNRRRSPPWRWCVLTLALSGAVASAAAAAAPLPASHPVAPKPPEPTLQRSAAPQVAEPDPASRNVVARARMLECGHQWSNLKKAGTAAGTWKDFSRGCLAQR